MCSRLDRTRRYSDVSKRRLYTDEEGGLCWGGGYTPQLPFLFLDRMT